jgi:ATP-dependent DNA helicase RecG
LIDHRSVTRNPNIARTFFRAGFVESWGRGTIKIIEECKKAGLLEPKIEELTGGVAITLYKNRTSSEFLASLSLNERQLNAIEYLVNNSIITSKIYQEKFDTSYRTAIRDLNGLLEVEIIKKIGDNKGSKYELK